MHFHRQPRNYQHISQPQFLFTNKQSQKKKNKNLIAFEFYSAPHNLDKRTTITIDDRTFIVEADDLEKISDLGHGAYGIVEKMRHRQTNTVMAVKRITATVNTQEQVSCGHKTSHMEYSMRFDSLFYNDICNLFARNDC